MSSNLDLELDEREFVFTMTTSGGPGGQHVNRSNTRVTLGWDYMNSNSLSDEQKERLKTSSVFQRRVNRSDQFSLSSDTHRSQLRNREIAIERLNKIVTEALAKKPKRKPTRVSRSVKERRLKDKKKRGEVKRSRKPPDV